MTMVIYQKIIGQYHTIPIYEKDWKGSTVRRKIINTPDPSNPTYTIETTWVLNIRKSVAERNSSEFGRRQKGNRLPMAVRVKTWQHIIWQYSNFKKDKKYQSIVTVNLQNMLNCAQFMVDMESHLRLAKRQLLNQESSSWLSTSGSVTPWRSKCNHVPFCDVWGLQCDFIMIEYRQTVKICARWLVHVVSVFTCPGEDESSLQEINNWKHWRNGQFLSDVKMSN